MTDFRDFQDLLSDENYVEAPLDWWIVITDIEDSTQAIESGRYKDVNTIGAATLAAIQNATGRLQFPFVFGGDGATALIPDTNKLAVEKELSALRSISRTQFRLELRVGMVSVQELHDQGLPVRIAKFRLEGNYPLAIFSGGALTRADKLIKNEADRYSVPEHPGRETNLRNLSCRWKPIPSVNGSMLSIIFFDPQGRNHVYTEFLQKLEVILDGDAERVNPVRVQSMSYRSVADILRHDRAHQVSLQYLVPRIVDTIAASILFRWGLFRLIPHINKYVNQTVEHSDFRKFDDMLRMILDCSSVQIDQLDALCKDLRASHGACFGLHRSDAALMTCFVPDFSEGSHIHFIDGSNGGYAVAAKQLKSQLRSTASSTDGA